MKLNRSIVFVVVFAVVFVVFYLEAHKVKPEDDVQIRNVLTGLEQVIEKKNTRIGLDLVSRRYMDELGTNYVRLKAEAQRVFRQSGQFQVDVSSPDVTVNADTASVNLKAVVSEINADGSSKVVFEGPVSLFFEREKCKKWVVLPDYRWRVTRSSGAASYFVSEIL